MPNKTIESAVSLAHAPLSQALQSTRSPAGRFGSNLGGSRVQRVDVHAARGGQAGAVGALAGLGMTAAHQQQLVRGRCLQAGCQRVHWLHRGEGP